MKFLYNEILEFHYKILFFVKVIHTPQFSTLVEKKG